MDYEPDLPDADRWLASAVVYLVQGGEHDAAEVLLHCDVSVSEGRFGGARLHLTGPRAVYEILQDGDHPVSEQVGRALNAVYGGYSGFTVRAQFLDTLDANWRTELLEIAAGRGVHNQAVDIPNRKIVLWKNLRFRSESEVRVAAALDAAGVLFLPNCLGRLGDREHRENKEADFLICADRRWGVLEVDGPHHVRAAQDHERDRLFRAYGIYVERFTAEECYQDAPGVVRKFLTLLARNG